MFFVRFLTIHVNQTVFFSFISISKIRFFLKSTVFKNVTPLRRSSHSLTPCSLSLSSLLLLLQLLLFTLSPSLLTMATKNRNRKKGNRKPRHYTSSNHNNNNNNNKRKQLFDKIMNFYVLFIDYLIISPLVFFYDVPLAFISGIIKNICSLVMLVVGTVVKVVDGVAWGVGRSVWFVGVDVPVGILKGIGGMFFLFLFLFLFLFFYFFILFYFILFYFILFYFILFYFILFYFILFYFILFYFILFYFILFYFILFYFILFYFILFSFSFSFSFHFHIHIHIHIHIYTHFIFFIHSPSPPATIMFLLSPVIWVNNKIHAKFNSIFYAPPSTRQV